MTILPAERGCSATWAKPDGLVAVEPEGTDSYGSGTEPGVGLVISVTPLHNGIYIARVFLAARCFPHCPPKFDLAHNHLCSLRLTAPAPRGVGRVASVVPFSFALHILFAADDPKIEIKMPVRPEKSRCNLAQDDSILL